MRDLDTEKKRNTDMEESLLLKVQKASTGAEEEEAETATTATATWGIFTGEVKKVGYLAGPMVAVTLSQYLLQVISVMMVGHLSELALSSTAIAMSLSGVTGFSLMVNWRPRGSVWLCMALPLVAVGHCLRLAPCLAPQCHPILYGHFNWCFLPVLSAFCFSKMGMASALETLCGQAYGAKQYQRIGTQTYTAIFCQVLVCLPLSLLWIYMGKLLALIGQDPQISHEAGKFTIWLVPALFAHATLQPLVRYFQTQSMITPMFLSSCATLLLHIPLCWALVFKSGLENVGGALAISISLWLNVIFLGVYMKFSPSCAESRVPISMELFQGIGPYFHFAIPSAVMVCLEWWSFELLVLMSGLLPNPQLETSVLSVCLNTISTLYAIPFGLGAAGSTRVSNELGAGNPQTARVAVYAVMFMAVTETIIISASLFASRKVFGYIFSNEQEVVDYVTTMAPLVCLSVILDSLQGVLSGVARGCGWQNIGAFVNLGAFYLCGIPIAAILGFWVKLRGMGLWIGIQAGAFTQTVLLAIITSCTNWEKQASKARQRIFEG